ncbi:MAG: flagellar protein FlgN [Agathobacter sp.]|nr:flagellar protein FlgN [Agathobacter sp.]
MAGLVDELVSVLVEEEKLYTVLLECAEKKTQILVDADIPALEQLTAEEQVKSDELLALGNKQIQLLNDIKTVLGRKDERLTVTSLISYLGSQPQVQEKLTTAKNNLIDVATKVQIKNQQNEILLRQAIELTEFDITLFKSMRQAPETANYNKNAYNTGTLLGGSGFDAKQ